uniref:Uncharacterized protein n=1 Tax=Setaria digitata TaxID=48799 RepID=A0A915Q6Y6_9BILA
MWVVVALEQCQEAVFQYRKCQQVQIFGINCVSNLMSSAHSKDYVNDVHMDISHQFFPLPSVAVPNIVINRPSVREYSFESERKAIADYEKNKAALAVNVREMKPTVGLREGEPNVTVKKLPDAAPELHMRSVHPNVVLQPSRIVALTSQQRSTKPLKPAANAFEEFESKPNLFDLLELSTIDDKAALEQILANASPSISTSVVGSGVQSSPRLLPSSSVPNMGLNVLEADDSRSMYNLSTTLKSCNSSFGIGISNTAFRQNL